MNIVTFNLRCVYEKLDGINSFIHRAGLIYEKVNAEKPDIIAFQEVVGKSLEMLTKLLPEYLFLGHFRNEDYSGEGVFTAIRRDKIEVLGFEGFWLSPTPYSPGTRYEIKSRFPRICIMTQLRYKENGKVFRVYNLHLDHESDEARRKGMECVFDFIKKNNEKSELSTIILGDFNAVPEDDVIKMCNNNISPKVYDVTKDIPITIHNFGKEMRKIDYIFMTNDLKENLKKVLVWDDECVWEKDVYHGESVPHIYLSDHYPVCAEIDI